MKLEMLDTPPCKDIDTGQEIDCEQCLQTYIDDDVTKRSCNMIPKGVQVIKCSCGLHIKMPLGWTYINCRKCNAYWKKNSDGEWYRPKSFRQQKMDRLRHSQKLTIQCDCEAKNIIVISDHTVERKCFACNHWWVKVDGNWIKSEHKEVSDANTMMDKAPDALKQILGVNDERKPTTTDGN